MPKHEKLNLFDDDDDEDGDIRNVDGNTLTEDFQLKISDEKLSDERTSKLIELQSKFAYDSRFKIDERFVEDEDDEDRDQEEEDDDEDDEQQQEDKELQQEKLKNLSILENVLGKSLKKSAVKLEDSKKGKKLTAPPAIGSSVLVPRFDPTKEETKIYEIDDPGTTSSGSKRGKMVQIDFDDDEIDQKISTKKIQLAAEAENLKKKKKNKNNKTKNDIAPKNLLENYYEISSDLKESLTNKDENFSFGSMLGLDSGKNDDHDLKLENESSTYESMAGDHRKRQLRSIRNPFKYDSSDSEEEVEEETEQKSTHKTFENKRIKFEDQEGPEEEDNVNIELTGASSSSAKSTGKFRSKSFSTFPLTFGGFFFTSNDSRFNEDQFFTKESVEKVCKDAKQRSILMAQAFRFRKQAAMKNAKTEKKYSEKQQNKLKMIRKGRKLKRNSSSRLGFARRALTHSSHHSRVVITKPTKT